MKSVLSLLILFLLLPETYAQQTGEPILFRGGMMLHTGYLQNTRSAQPVSGYCKGIGGQLNFSIGRGFRVGTEGYTSQVPYAGQDGYYKMSWGGILTGYQLSQKKLHPVIGLTLGMGKVKDLFFLQQADADNEPDQVFFQKYPVLLCTPSVSAEYSLKSNLSLVLRLDYQILIFSEHRADFARGPRLYLGILFNRD